MCIIFICYTISYCIYYFNYFFKTLFKVYKYAISLYIQSNISNPID